MSRAFLAVTAWGVVAMNICMVMAYVVHRKTGGIGDGSLTDAAVLFVVVNGFPIAFFGGLLWPKLRALASRPEGGE